MGILRDRMIEEMKLRNFSPATQESYVYAVSRLAKYHHKSPDQLSKEDIRAFLVHLTVERKLSPNSLTGYCCGLRFFYNETLGWDETKLFIPPRKEVFSPARGVQSRRGHAIDRRSPRSQATCFTDDRLFGRTQSQGVSESQDRRHRCCAHDHSREARQRRQGPLWRPVAEAGCGAAPVLETLPAFYLAFPQPSQERPVKPRGSLAYLPLGEEKSRA